MADGTGISWTDATWNPVTGCSVTSPGCTNCYAMRLAGTRMRHHPSRVGLTREVNGNHAWTGEVRLNAQWLGQPLAWQRPRDIFVVAHGDLFHENVPDAWIDCVFAIAALAPQHRFQILTKRPERAAAYLRNLLERSHPAVNTPTETLSAEAWQILAVQGILPNREAIQYRLRAGLDGRKWQEGPPRW